MLTSALVEGRDFLRARAEAKRRAAVPEGTPVVFAGGRTRHATEDDALTFGNNVWAKRERIRRRTYKTREEARQDVFDYVEMFYNPVRKQVRNGMLSPVEFERQQILKAQGV